MTQFFCRLVHCCKSSRLYEKIVCPVVLTLLLLMPGAAMPASVSFAVDATLSENELSETSRVIRAIAGNLAPGTSISLVVFDRVYQNGVPMAVVNDEQLKLIDSVLAKVTPSTASNIATGIEKAFSDVAEQESAQIVLIGNAAITLEETEKVEKYTQWLDLVLMPKMLASDVTLTIIDSEKPNDPALEAILANSNFTQMFSYGEAEQTAKKIAMVLPSDLISEADVTVESGDSLDTDSEGNEQVTDTPISQETTTDQTTSEITNTGNGGSAANEVANETTTNDQDSNTTTTDARPSLGDTTEDTTDGKVDRVESNDEKDVNGRSPGEPQSSSNRILLLAAFAFLLLATLGAAVFFILRKRKNSAEINPVPDNKTIKKEQGRYFSADESHSANELFNKNFTNPDAETQLRTTARSAPEQESGAEINTVERSAQADKGVNLGDTLPKAKAVDATQKKSTIDTELDQIKTTIKRSDTSDLDELRSITQIKHKGNNIE